MSNFLSMLFPASRYEFIPAERLWPSDEEC